ncbi:hypothetical protein [Amaricoccus sp.]|uniref:hypothetical protein n=1 Tax=Amaricoccus sp. TaxID=1872485 RepID=UPI00260776F2|nr:hypothetical protein [Amaricoccus sp.]HRO10253.1 hypothetical protein [Amaricoccus sp.]
MSTPSPSVTPQPPTVAFPPQVMEPLHAELAITYLGAVVGMAGSMLDLAVQHGAPADDAQEQAAAAVRRSLVEAPELLATLTGRPFAVIVEEFVRGARVPAADRSCRAARLLERIMQAAQ